MRVFRKLWSRLFLSTILCNSNSDFEGVEKPAHRIKGSASYLCCEVLKEISLRLQDAGKSGSTSEHPDQVWQLIRNLFEDFKEALAAVKEEIANNPQA